MIKGYKVDNHLWNEGKTIWSNYNQMLLTFLGVQTAIFKCFRETKQMIVNDKRCRNVGKPQHPPPLRCNDNPCPPR